MTDDALALWKRLLDHPGVLSAVVKDGGLELHHLESDGTTLITDVQSLFNALGSFFASTEVASQEVTVTEHGT